MKIKQGEGEQQMAMTMSLDMSGEQTMLFDEQAGEFTSAEIMMNVSSTMVMEGAENMAMTMNMDVLANIEKSEEQ